MCDKLPSISLGHLASLPALSVLLVMAGLWLLAQRKQDSVHMTDSCPDTAAGRQNTAWLHIGIFLTYIPTLQLVENLGQSLSEAALYGRSY